MRKLTFLILLNLQFLVAAGNAIPVPPEIKKAVAFIYLFDNQSNPIALDHKGNLLKLKQESPVGTGFLIGVKRLGMEDSYGTYLVTNKHVLQKSDGSTIPILGFRVNLIKGGVEIIKVPLVEKGDKKNIFFHNDPSVDLAVIIPKGLDLTKHDFKFMLDDLLTSKEDLTRLEVGEGTDVFFVGLFGSHFGQQKNTPVVRFGKLAEVTDEKVNWNGVMTDLYLLEATSIGGHSGSPVFFYLEGFRRPGVITAGGQVFKLAGVMQGYFNELSEIQMFQPTQVTPIPVAVLNSGISAIVPAYKLHEILFSDELKALRSKKT